MSEPRKPWPYMVDGWGEVLIEQLPQLNHGEIVRLNMLVGQQVSRIKSQLESARARRFSEGIFADPDWFRRANGALRAYGFLHQAILAEFGRRRGERREANVQEELRRQTFEREFVGVAKRTLDAETFTRLVKLAGGEIYVLESGEICFKPGGPTSEVPAGPTPEGHR